MKEKDLSRPIVVVIIVVVVIGIVLFNLFTSNNNNNTEKSKVENNVGETTSESSGKKYLEGEGYTPVRDEATMYFENADLNFFNMFYSDGVYEVTFFQTTMIKLLEKNYKIEAIDYENNLLELEVVEKETRYDEYYGTYFKDIDIRIKTPNQPLKILIECDGFKYSYNVPEQV